MYETRVFMDHTIPGLRARFKAVLNNTSTDNLFLVFSIGLDVFLFELSDSYAEITAASF
jgi:hypothetical protein